MCVGRGGGFAAAEHADDDDEVVGEDRGSVGVLTGVEPGKGVAETTTETGGD